MWIWELPAVNRGNLTSIIATAHQYGVGTLMIKSSDGTTFWSQQFTPQLVAKLHAGGLKVCAWQYVDGNHPVTEAYMGAQAVKDGADCLLIDAEVEVSGQVRRRPDLHPAATQADRRQVPARAGRLPVH